MHFCMGAYGEDSSRLRNFGGFKLVSNLKETKEAKCNTDDQMCAGQVLKVQNSGNDQIVPVRIA